MTVDKKTLSERDICTKYITPALQAAGWDIHSQIREQLYFTKGRVFVRGKTVKRGKAKFADYVLYHQPDLPLAIVEAKDNKHSVGDGMQQALDYAEILDLPFAFSSNGDAFLFHDRSGQSSPVERELTLDTFPSPAELWASYVDWKQLNENQQRLVEQPSYDDGSGKSPRYYQQIAINRTIEAIAKGQDRILLVMATGTGKTYTAFQIIWRLWKSKKKKRILFLADRNILVDQTMVNDFRPFKGAMAKLSVRSKTIATRGTPAEDIPTAIDAKSRQVDPSYEIYLSLYQAITGPDERQKVYKGFSREFFDLVIIDECHRGSAAEDSAWREILEYFDSATQIGLTATPKETKYVSNIHYFGDPIYTYSLKTGIEDGFLAPYKVVRIDIDKDLQGWPPEQGKKDKHGELVEDRTYNQQDMDRSLVLEKRTELVAAKITEFLKGTSRYDKTIVFCEDIDHAERMRQALANANSDITADNRKYVMRITGDNEAGKAELDNFILPDSVTPVIATTSKLMTTGVDAKTCKLIVLDRIIRSMTEFKQIIGRGTRIEEDYGKMYFTIMDFKKATELFADPDFDGEPVQVYEPGPDEPPIPPDEKTNDSEDDAGEGLEGEGDTTIVDPPPGPGPRPRVKYVVDDVPVWVVAERVQYYSVEGKLITESLKSYTRKKVRENYATLDQFLSRWKVADQKQVVVEELEDNGLLLEALQQEVGKDYEPFDLICHVAFDQPPLTRRERAESVRKRDYFTKYGEQARAVLNALLDKYADEGLATLEDVNTLRLQPISDLGTPIEIINLFGGKDNYLEAIHQLQTILYESAA